MESCYNTGSAIQDVNCFELIMQAFCIHIDTIQDSLLPRIFEEKVLGKAQNNYLARLLLILSYQRQY